MNSNIIIRAIKQAWDRKTCYPRVRTSWTADLPERGQCAVTALLVQEVLGGRIVYNSEYDHYWNVLRDGKQLDLTKKQFGRQTINPETRVSRNDILNSDAAKKFKTSERYILLKERVSSLISLPI